MPVFEKLAQLAGAALFLLAGAALVQLLPGLRALPRGRRLAHAYLLGVAWLAGGLYALSYLFAVPLRRPAILALAAAPVLAWLILRHFFRAPKKAGGLRAAPKRRWTKLELAALGAAGLVFLAVLADTVTYPLRDWDGRMTWGTQARYIRAEATVSPRVITEPGWHVKHPWYPVLMPVAQVAVLELLRAGEDEQPFRGLYAFFYPAWLLILYGGARRWTRRSTAALTVLAAALLPMPAFQVEGGAVSAYSDLPLACFYGAAFLLLVKARPRLSEGAAAGMLLAAAVLTKNEGAPLALWALAVAFFLAPGTGIMRRRWRPFLLAAVLVAGALLLLFAWRSGIPARYESLREDISWSNFWPGVVLRVPQLAPRIWSELAEWDLFWSAAVFVALAGWRGLRRPAAPALLLAAIGPLGIAWLTYAICLDPVMIATTTVNRFVLQASIPLLLLFALALDDLLRRASWLPHALGGPSRSPSRRPRRPTESPGPGEPPIAAPDPPTASG